MHILWRLEKAFVKEILAEIPKPKPPITTLSSLVRKLEAEDWIDHESFGKTHRYFPKVKKQEYLKHTFRNMVNTYFEGSSSSLLSFFLKEENVAAEDLDQILKDLESEDPKKS